MTLPMLLLLGGGLVWLCHLLPHARPRSPIRATVLILVGFILAQASLSAAITELGLVPKGEFHDLLHQQTAYNGERPVVLLIGSSFTGAGVDPDTLAERLSESGQPATVQRIAVGGAPHLERLHYLREYLARTRRQPQLVLFEIAGGYDSGPLYQVHQMRFSDRMVAMMDGSSALWALRWLKDDDHIGLSQRLMMGCEILGELALHISHIGFFWNSALVDDEARSAPATSWPPAAISDDDAAELLDQAAVAQNLKPDWPSEVPTPWMRAFLAEEISVLQGHGVERFAFYSVPSMEGANVAYARRFCATVSGSACIVGEDPDLLARLRHGTDWYDFDHLQGKGREVFTKWLGDRMVEMGVWP